VTLEGLVAVATAPGARRSLLGMAVSAVAARSKRRGGKLAAVAAEARKHVVTAAALASMDLGAFQVWHHGGWFAVCASLLLLHFEVTG